MTNLYFRVYSDGTPKDITYLPEEPSYADGWFRVVEIYAPGMPNTQREQLDRIEEDIKRLKEIALRKEMRFSPITGEPR